MDSRFFTDIHDMFQIVIILQRQSDGNLVQIALRQDIEQVFNRPQNLDTLIKSAAGYAVVKDASYNVSPLGIGIDTIDILLRCAGLSHQQNIFYVIAFLAEVLQQRADQGTTDIRKQYIEDIEIRHHGTREMVLRNQIPECHQ